MGTAIYTKGSDMSGTSNNFYAPVSNPLAWGNFESDAVRESRRLRNWGKYGGTFSLSGIAKLVAVGIAAQPGTESRVTLGNYTPDAYTLIALVDVGASAAIMRHRNIRIYTDASKKLMRIMDGGTVTSTITAPDTGAFVVFLSGDLAGHSFGMVTSTSAQKATSNTAATGTTATSLGGLNSVGSAAAWSAFGSAFYDRKLTDNEMMQVAENLIGRALRLGVNANG
ncbi:TPA: hypothetical protein MFA25_004195 [Klebsiella pneumoniae]|uniref:hypothetical protein n=1 Tax=Klebsiella pneumoniae TaxID=573 RepID=UPI0013303620|nr:hypothetical protein [Klebsiella pneumoniae]MEC5511096.1 hypothetical protein [Klebsiella pneumoniae]MEC5600605.1 hypothetical protein [Klebsiella pneumoniae]HBW5254039.1 hypothetical protein [Klebsiella pneumoniae]HBW6375628.1 hypothetical protein [Klebsiella pneumoniae]